MKLCKECEKELKRVSSSPRYFLTDAQLLSKIGARFSVLMLECIGEEISDTDDDLENKQL